MKFLPVLATASLLLVPGDEPPPGPPWHLTYHEAREHALRAGQPVFVYFTKTYCPHCVPVEEMLSRKELESVYGKVTWLFVSRNFKGDEKDREAYRTHDRFGISSWPQMVVFDPRNDEVLAEPPRGLEGFKSTLERAGENDKFSPVRTASGAEAREAAADGSITSRMEDGDARTRAIALEDATLAIAGEGQETSSLPLRPEKVLERLLDPQEDIVVRVRALRYLRAAAPALASAKAGEVLGEANDPLRYDYLEVLAEHPNEELSAELAEIFAGAGRSVPSRNPNVLRMHAAKALKSCGTPDAVDAMRGIASEANPMNSTTRFVVDALGAIGSRAKGSGKREVIDALFDAFPAGADDPSWGENPHERLPRMAHALAENVRAALATATGDDLPPVPDSWTVETRERYVAQLRKRVR